MTNESEFLDARAEREAALGYIMEAWFDARHDGIEPEAIANAALFAALSDLVATYGEDPVVKFADGLADRVRQGEFTLDRITQ